MYENLLIELKNKNFNILKNLKEKDIIFILPELEKIKELPGSTFREKLYLFLFYQEGKCQECGKKTKFIDSQFKYRSFCSKKCSNSNKELCEKRTKTAKESNLITYGVESTTCLETVKQKMKVTNVERYGLNYNKNKFKKICEKHGVKNISALESVKKKKENICLKKFGVKNNFQSDVIKKKSKETNLKKHGEIPGFGSNKYKKTILEKYGVENVAQVTEIFEKRLHSCKKFKKYILPSGKVVKVQGYENKVLDYLFNNQYLENDLRISNKEIENEIGKIFFEYENKKRRYYPDIFIKSKNLIIEVKSRYTFKLKTDFLEAKKDACLKLGFDFKIFIFDNNSVIIKNSFKND